MINNELINSSLTKEKNLGKFKDAQSFASQTTEIDIKSLVNSIYTGLIDADNATSVPPYRNKLDVTVAPNEYSNLFAFNRVLKRLLINDLSAFNTIGIYPMISKWADDKVYSKGDRVLLVNDNDEVADKNFKASLYVCLADNVEGSLTANTPGLSSNTIKFYNSLYDADVGDNLWAEEIPLLDSFNISTKDLSLEEFNKKPIESLSTFSFNEASSLIETTTPIAITALSASQNLAWPSNPPKSYNNITVETLSSSILSNSQTNPNNLYIINKAQDITNIKSGENRSDYVISSVIVNDPKHKAWARIWKSGWIEQGGVDAVNFTVNDITFADDTYLIGINGNSNLCIKHQIDPIFNNTVEFMTTFTDVQELKFEGISSVAGETISSETEMTAFIPFDDAPSSELVSSELSVITVSCDIPGHSPSEVSTLIVDHISGYVSAWTDIETTVLPDTSAMVEMYDEYIYNVQAVYQDEIENSNDLHIIYQSPAIYFSGVCTELSSKNAIDIKSLIETNEISASAKISWESQGILRPELSNLI